MFEIQITISCPDLVTAAALITKSINSAKAESQSPATNSAPTIVSAPVTAVPTEPTHHTDSTLELEPAVPVTPVVPLAQAPTYTMAQISKAGADLISQNPGLLPQVNALLAQYGIQAVTDIKPEHYGAFATALRGLGAKI